MQYGGKSFSSNKLPTITYKTGDQAGESVQAMGGLSKFGMSSLDVYQICKMYECSRCAHRDIPTYQGKAHESYMYKCKSTKYVK